jgi:hypothetical protein
MLDASIASMTLDSRTLQNRPDLALLVRRDRLLAAAEQHVGWMPMLRSSRTECCVGLVFSSPPS